MKSGYVVRVISGIDRDCAIEEKFMSAEAAFECVAGIYNQFYYEANGCDVYICVTRHMRNKTGYIEMRQLLFIGVNQFRYR